MVTGAAITVIVSAYLVFVSIRIVDPPEVTPAEADAVVVFAGGDGERLDRAQAVMDQGVSDTLVLNVNTPTWVGPAAQAQNEMCNSEQTFEVICVEAIDSTLGEGLAFSQLAKERGWESLLVVTGKYHVSRAVAALDQCSDVTIYETGAPQDASPQRFFRELFKLSYTYLFERNCTP